MTVQYHEQTVLDMMIELRMQLARYERESQEAWKEADSIESHEMYEAASRIDARVDALQHLLSKFQSIIDNSLVQNA